MSEPILLVRPYPQRQEGRQGYLLRLAEANFLTLRDLEQLDIRFTSSSLLHNQLLPDKTLDPDLHAHVERISTLVDNVGRSWNRQYARFCPHCLDESSVWQAAWELIFHDACPRHGVWLVDQCSSCGSLLRWNRQHLLRCACGADLRAESARASPLAVQHLSAVVASQLQVGQIEAEFGIPLLQGMSVGESQRLIRFLGGYLDPCAGAKPLKLQHAGQMSASWPVTSLAAEILRDWPHAFHASLNQLQKTVQGEKIGLQGFLHHAYHYLYHGLRGRSFDPVRDAFEHWLAEHWKGGIAKRNRRLASHLLAAAQWIPGNVVCDLLGVSMTRLRYLIQEGKLEGQESISTTGRRFLMVRRDLLDQLSVQLASEMTMSEAVVSLGLGKIRMRQMLPLLFPNARRATDSEFMPWCVPRGEVEALLAIGQDLPVLGIPDEQQVSLAHVLQFWNWSAEEIVALVEAVKAGALVITAQLDSARGIGRWVFDVSQLRAWQLGLSSGLSNWLSIPDTAKVLGVKQQVAYWLVRNQLLTAEKLARKKGVGFRIHREKIERFRQRYIFGTEIAAALSRSSRKVRLLLEAQGIRPVILDGVEPCRQLLYPRSEMLQCFIQQAGSSVSAEVFELAGDVTTPSSEVGKSQSLGRETAACPTQKR